jgi:hypothetical protein
MNCFQENVLITDKCRFTLKNNILKIITVDSGIVVLFDNTSLKNDDLCISNICLYDEYGEHKWDAELPKQMPYSTYEPGPYEDLYSPYGDSYLKKDEIAASSFRWHCILDIVTGKIKEMHANK